MTNPQKTILTSTSTEHTETIGRTIAKHLENGTVVSIQGTLGAGKTVLSRAIAQALGITEHVTSPTFALVMEYQRPNKDEYLYHLDMYRIDNELDAVAFGVEDYLFQPNAITLVEWPERLAGLLAPPPNNAKALVHITLAHAGENTRQIELPTWLA